MLHKPISHKSKAWLLYVCLLTLFAGCSKCNKVIEPDKTSTASLPAATQTGAGTFGCMVNGQAWTPYGRQSFLSALNPSGGYDPVVGAFSVSADIYLDKPVNGSNLKEYINVGGINVYTVGEYNLTNSTVLFEYFDGVTAYYSDTDIASDCKLIVKKLDKINKIISGTFSFTIQKKDTGKKVIVTDGRFDLKYL